MSVPERMVYAEDLEVGMRVAFLGPDEDYEFHEVALLERSGDITTAAFADQPPLRLGRGTVIRIDATRTE